MEKLLIAVTRGTIRLRVGDRTAIVYGEMQSPQVRGVGEPDFHIWREPAPEWEDVRGLMDQATQANVLELARSELAKLGHHSVIT